MLEFLLLAVFVVAIVAIDKANGAMKENAALKLELERMRSQLERKPASKEEDSQAHPTAEAGEASHVAGHSRTPTVPIIPQRAPEARPPQQQLPPAPQRGLERPPQAQPAPPQASHGAPPTQHQGRAKGDEKKEKE